MGKMIGSAVLVIPFAATIGLGCGQTFGIQWPILLDYLGRAHVEYEYVVATGYLSGQATDAQQGRALDKGHAEHGCGVGSGLDGHRDALIGLSMVPGAMSAWMPNALY